MDWRKDGKGVKFTYGGYRLREGVTAIYPKRVWEHHVEGETLVLRIRDRADSLIFEGQFITVRISSPMPDVIRVRASHNEGGRKPMVFPVEENLPAASPEIREEEDCITFVSGSVALRIQKNPWEIQFMAGGRAITATGGESLGLMRVKGQPYMMNRLNLGVGECIYGMGERFGPFVKNGQSVEIWNDDGGTWTDLAYKNIPFYLSNKGYGLLVNSPAKVEFEVATERCEQIQLSVPGEMLDYYFFYGPGPKDVIEKYTVLTGRPALPPAWSFGLWLTTSFVTQYDESIVNEHIDGMLARDIPLKVFHYDCSWMKDFHWCDFTWDEQEFPDPVGMIKRLKEKGIRICVWINPYISQFSSIFEEGKENGYFLKTRGGGVYQCDWWQPGLAFVDFTNPEAVAWYQSKLRALLKMGVDTFKTDFGETIPDDAVYFDGSEPKEMHNFYSYLYNKAVFGLLESFYGRGSALVFARSATAGSQKFPVHWGGDTVASFESMAEELRGGLSFAASGFGFWSHDIGGFGGTATPALYKRWVAWGLFSSHSRLHGYDSYRVPWLFDEESVDVLRFFTKTKNRLMPYLFAAAADAHTHGWPMLRPMVMEFPDDPTCAHLDRQYMLGDSLLVAPVMNEESVAEYYLPAGRWTHFFTGKVVEGGRWITEQVDFMSMPVFVRENTVLPIGTEENRPDYDFSKGLTLNLFEIADGADICTTIPNQDGSPAVTFRCRRKGNRITVERDGRADNWRMMLTGTKSVRSVVNGKDELAAAADLTVIPSASAREVAIEL